MAQANTPANQSTLLPLGEYSVRPQFDKSFANLLKQTTTQQQPIQI